MSKSILTTELVDALANYRRAIGRATDQEAREDYLRLAEITDKIIASIQSDDDAGVKLGLLGFSRQVSDAFSAQPPEFKALAGKIAKLKRLTT